MFEALILIGAGLFCFYCYYQSQEFKSRLEKTAKVYCEEEIFKINRSHEYQTNVLKDELHATKELVSKLRASKEKAEVSKKVSSIEKALASFI